MTKYYLQAACSLALATLVSSHAIPTGHIVGHVVSITLLALIGIKDLVIWDDYHYF